MEPQHLSAEHGWSWIKQGYRLFMKAPLLWLVLLLIIFFLAVAASSIPVVGEPLASLLMPALLISLAVGCRTLEQGEDLELALLASGFQRHTTALIALGGITLVSEYLILGLMMATGGTDLVNMMQSPQPPEDPAIVMQTFRDAMLPLLLGASLSCILFMAMQFAPMLVYFDGIQPIEALKLSLRAFMNNIGAMLVYFTTFMLLAILGSIPMFLGWLVLIPMAFTSIYAAYRDIFPAPVETGSEQQMLA